MTASEVLREIEVPFSGIVLEVMRDTKAEEEEVSRAVLDLVLMPAAFASRSVLLVAEALDSEADEKISIANSFGILASHV
jgi:hypothetical protein